MNSLITAEASILASQKTKKITTRKEFIKVEKNIKLHVTDLGEGNPIVLIHGWPLSNAMFEYQYHSLIENGYRVICITLRGFGKSDKPYSNYNYDVFAQDIHIIIKKLNLQNVTLGGFSMGGAIAIHYVAKYNNPVIQKLALFGAAAPQWTAQNDPSINFTKESVNELIALSKVNRPKLIENFGKLFAANNNALPLGITNWLYGINMEASAYATTQSLIALRDSDLSNELSQISLPTAIFHGELDAICKFSLAEQIHRGIANSYIVKFRNSGHGLFLEEKEKFNSELIAFLQK